MPPYLSVSLSHTFGAVFLTTMVVQYLRMSWGTVVVGWATHDELVQIGGMDWANQYWRDIMVFNNANRSLLRVHDVFNPEVFLCMIVLHLCV